MTNGPGQVTDLLQDVVDLLNQQQTDYVVIGALAVAVHGVVRASLDADALVSVNVRRLQEISQSLADKGLNTELRRGDFADPIPAMLIITDDFGNHVDLLAGLRGLDPGVYSRAVELPSPWAGRPLRFAGPEDLIAMKLFAGSAKDLLDARRVLAVSSGSLNLTLLRQLCVRFGRDTQLRCEQLLQQPD